VLQPHACRSADERGLGSRAVDEFVRQGRVVKSVVPQLRFATEPVVVCQYVANRVHSACKPLRIHMSQDKLRTPGISPYRALRPINVAVREVPGQHGSDSFLFAGLERRGDGQCAVPSSALDAGLCTFYVGKTSDPGKISPETLEIIPL